MLLGCNSNLHSFSNATDGAFWNISLGKWFHIAGCNGLRLCCILLHQTNLDDKTDVLLVPTDSSFSRRSAVSIVHHFKLRRDIEHATLTFALYPQHKPTIFMSVDSTLHNFRTVILGPEVSLNISKKYFPTVTEY
jgi:hypothetical protein